MPPSPKRPLRLLTLASRYWPVFSGASAQQHEMLTRLGREKIEATVLTFRRPGLSVDETIDGVRIVRPGAEGIDSVSRAVFALRVFLHVLARSRRYDVIHSFSAGWAAFLLPLAARIAGVPCIYTSSLQGSDDADSVAAQSLGRVKVGLLRMYQAFATYTSQQTQAFVESGFDADRAHTVTCGVDDRYYTPATDAPRRKELRAAAGRDDEGPVILFIGTVTERKGVDLLLESFRLLLPRSPQAVLVLMGPVSREEDPTLDESFVKRLRERCAEPELAGHVVFLGRVDSADEKRSILQASDTLALFSQHEGLGIVILEAMACGVPAVLTPIPGVFDYVVDDGRDGRIVGSRDPVELSNALFDVLASEDRRAAMGRNARETIERRFSMERIASTYLQLYRQLARKGE